MHTTALGFPLTPPPLHKPASFIRVLRRPRPERKRVPAPALIKPQSRWTVVAALVLAVILHVAPVVIAEMKLDTPRVETTQALSAGGIPTPVN